MEFDCKFWNICLGSTSLVLLLCVMLQLILLICSRRKLSRIKSAVKHLKLDIESGVGETESKRRDLDALKIARKQGTPLPIPKGDNIENVYETIKPNEKSLLAVRDSLSVRLKNKLLNRKGRNKIVTFRPEQFEVIPDSLSQITSEEELSVSMSDILEQLPSTSRNQIESTYITMHDSKKLKAEMNLNQTTEKSREQSHVYAQCKKPPPLPRGSSIAKLKSQFEGTLGNKSVNVSNFPVSSNNQNVKTEQYFDKATTGIEILNTDCEDESDEDEMYNREIERYIKTNEPSSTSSGRGSKPILPKKLSIKSQSGIFDVEHQIEESGHDATSLDSYDILPAPRPITTISRSGNELVPPTPYCGRKILYNSPTPSRKSNISETSIASKTHKKSKMTKKLKKVENYINSLRWKKKSKQDKELDTSRTIGSLVQNSFYNPTGSHPKFPTEERKPSLSDINRLQERLNMTDTSPDRFSSASSIATPPILRRTSNVGQPNDDEGIIPNDLLV